MRRKKILTFVGYYLPGFRGGGPIRSIANLVEVLGGDYDFFIVTSDRDLGDDAPYEGIEGGCWEKVGNARVRYLSKSEKSFFKFCRLVNELDCDVLYLNSFFDRVFSIQVLLARRLGLIRRAPILISPRGEFALAALAIRSAKKRVFISLARILGLHKGANWQASNPHELSQLEDFSSCYGIVIPQENLNVASDLSVASSVVPKSLTEHASLDGLRICFLSRLSPMKNLDFAINVLGKVKSNICFDIYGPKESLDYWVECEKRISMLPGHIRVRYLGEVESSGVVSAIRPYDLFFVPSRGENYGHVFAESLAAGVPILVSDMTPWRKLEELGIGWDWPLSDVANFVSSIESYARLSPSERLSTNLCCLRYSQNARNEDLAVHANRRMLDQVASQLKMG